MITRELLEIQIHLTATADKDTVSVHGLTRDTIEETAARVVLDLDMSDKQLLAATEAFVIEVLNAANKIRKPELPFTRPVERSDDTRTGTSSSR